MNVTRPSLVPNLLLDGMLTVAVGAIVFWGSRWVGQVPPRHPIDLVAQLLMGTTVAALFARRLWPVPVLGVTTAATVAYLALLYPYGPVFLPFLVAMYTVAAATPLRTAIIAGVLAIVACMVPNAAVLPRDNFFNGAVTLLLSHTWMVAPWIVGAVVRLHHDTVERDREEMGKRRAYEERLLVARDVHDVVGHSLAVINMQAGVALHVLDRRPEQARVALDAIRQSSKDALDELRGTLAVFRRTDAADDSRRPAAGLGQIEQVITKVTESGRSVELTVSGEGGSLPAAVDLAAYRIVQESLTNFVRHAGPASAQVRITYEPRQVTVEVTDDGRHTAQHPGPSGTGIVGMRERATAVGGALDAGPRPEGGFRVVARLPYGNGR
jgi:signal transduction histidine kinase